MSTASKQPTLFEVFGRSQSPVVSSINEGALNQLTDILTSSGEEMGKVVLLRSPRAGYGKTLLLHSISSRLSETFRFLAVEPSGGGRIDGEVVLESVVRQLSEVLPASGGLTEFDLFARRLLALGLKPLLISGEIPSHDREGALYAIENRPIETFDFHHQQAATAHWTQANFEVLGPRLASELSEVSRCSLRGCAYWIDLLFRYATTPPEKVERTRLLSDAIFGDLAGQSGSGAEDRLQSLLALMSLIEPVVLVFDETEGLSNQPEAGLKVAAFVVQLRQACPALTVILAVNEDVWETGLSPLMPGGLADRLTEYEVELGALSKHDAEALLSSRFGDDAPAIATHMKWPDPISARAVLREGAQAARVLEAEGVLSERPVSVVEQIAGVTLPPPLEEVQSDAGESFEEKADRILEPTSSFESEETLGFDALDREPTPLAEPEPQAAPTVTEEDPFVEPEIEIEPASSADATEAASPSPFEIVPEPKAAEPAPVAAEPEASPFSAVEPEVEAVTPDEPATGGWSAESAMEQFAASQSANEKAPATPPELPQSDPEPAGAAFDAPAQASPEPSPFQVHQEEQQRREREAQEQEARRQAEAKAAAASTAAAASEPSPFAVSEPAKEPTQPVPEKATPAAAEQVPSSPFSAVSEPKPTEQAPAVSQPAATPPTERVQVAASQPATAPAPETPKQAVPTTAPVTEQALPPAATPASSPEPVTTPIPQPKQEEAPRMESPFAASSAPAASSPFASVSTQPEADASKAPVSGHDSADVEELLSQFKKRFGQSDS